MSNTEPVYQHSYRIDQVLDTKPINEILSNYLDRDISNSESTLRMIALRHKLLALVQKKPTSFEELDKFQIEANKVISESIWSTEDQRQLLNFCNKHWKAQLLEDSAKEAVKSIKDQLGTLLPVMTKAEIGFLVLKCVKSNYPSEDFIFEKVLPVIKELNISSVQLGKICAVLLKKYQELEQHFD